MKLREVVWTVRGTFKFLFYEEDGLLAAHCLDTDTVATGDNVLEAIHNLQISIEMEIKNCAKNGDFSTLWESAPGEFTALIQNGKNIITAIHEAKYPGFQKIADDGDKIEQGLECISAKLNEALHT